METDEAHEDALRRELMEELGIRADKLSEIFRHTHKYSDEFMVNLRFYRVHSFTGVLQTLRSSTWHGRRLTSSLASISSTETCRWWICCCLFRAENCSLKYFACRRVSLSTVSKRFDRIGAMGILAATF